MSEEKTTSRIWRVITRASENLRLHHLFCNLSRRVPCTCDGFSLGWDNSHVISSFFERAPGLWWGLILLRWSSLPVSSAVPYKSIWKKTSSYVFNSYNEKIYHFSRVFLHLYTFSMELTAHPQRERINTLYVRKDTRACIKACHVPRQYYPLSPLSERVPESKVSPCERERESTERVVLK